jgi:hypothetical protein
VGAAPIASGGGVRAGTNAPGRWIGAGTDVPHTQPLPMMPNVPPLLPAMLPLLSSACIGMPSDPFDRHERTEAHNKGREERSLHFVIP